jgi:hypothetical protein
MTKFWFTIREGPIHILPVLHERVEFADAARMALEALRPDVVAVELPWSLTAHVSRAVERLPQASVLLYESRKGVPLYLTVAPADPLVEGIRWGLEQGVPVHMVDVDVDFSPSWHEPVPDSYAALRLGAEAYYAKAQESGMWRSAHPLDRLREQGMAFRLQQMAKEGKRVLFICGMAHAERIRKDLRGPLTQPMDRGERGAVQVFNLHPESLQEVLWEPPLIHTVYEMRRTGLPAEPEISSLDRNGRAAGPFRVLRGGGAEQPDDQSARVEAARWCARRCHWMGALGNDRQESMTFEELLRDGGVPPPEDAHLIPVDRQKILWRWLQRASALYMKRTGERVQPWQIHRLMRFSRNYSMLDGRLLPDFYQWVSSARACVDENFAYEMWELGCVYPWQKEVALDLPTTRIHGEDLWLGTRRIRIRPRFPRRRKAARFPVRKRKKESRPGEWAEAFDGESLCSYPPEDILVEGFGGYLRSKGVRLLSEDRNRVEPFTSSLLDGIDMRETLRNWHEGRIYVREVRRAKGGVGAVVVIFDPDPDGKRYPYRMTWHGEHDQESDMAFYATSLGGQLVGPGISRCEYGGFVMTYPPRRMGDVWKDPAYRVLSSRPEVLLMAGLDYSLEPTVVYVAAQPPRSWFHTLAGRMGLKILYIPLGQFSSRTLKKLRVLHVLSGYDKRAIAKDYIHKE